MVCFTAAKSPVFPAKVLVLRDFEAPDGAAAASSATISWRACSDNWSAFAVYYIIEGRREWDREGAKEKGKEKNIFEEEHTHTPWFSALSFSSRARARQKKIKN